MEIKNIFILLLIKQTLCQDDEVEIDLALCNLADEASSDKGFPPGFAPKAKIQLGGEKDGK